METNPKKQYCQIRSRGPHNMILNLNFDLPVELRRCSRGFPGGWFRNVSKCHLKINIKERFTEQNYDCFSNGRNIQLLILAITYCHDGHSLKSFNPNIDIYFA